MIIIECPDAYHKAMKWAQEHGKLDNLLHALYGVTIFADRQDREGKGETWKCVKKVEIRLDSYARKYDETYNTYGDWKMYMNGGIIFHQGSQEWSVHT